WPVPLSIHAVHNEEESNPMGPDYSEIAKRLADSFDIPLQDRRGMILIHLENCGRFVEACDANKVLILGIEGFRLSGGAITPDSDLIADFSDLCSMPWDAACVESVRSAGPYFESARNQGDLWFEFVLQDREQTDDSRI